MRTLYQKLTDCLVYYPSDDGLHADQISPQGAQACTGELPSHEPVSGPRRLIMYCDMPHRNISFVLSPLAYPRYHSPRRHEPNTINTLSWENAELLFLKMERFQCAVWGVFYVASQRNRNEEVWRCERAGTPKRHS